MDDFDFARLQNDLANVNNIVSIIAGSAPLLRSAFGELLDGVGALAQAYQELKTALEEKDAMIKEMEGTIANLKKNAKPDRKEAE